MRALTLAVGAARLGAAALIVRRLAGAARTAEPVRAGPTSVPTTDANSTPIVSVVVPARDEAERIGPLLDSIVGAPGVAEVIVVDDESSDDTAAIAARLGSRVVAGAPKPT
ncbi:MAG: glycosyltransferase, partial [Actinomycetota bacterium]